MRTTMLVALSFILSLDAASVAAVQTQTPAPAPRQDSSQLDARWAPWLGCWRADGPAGRSDVRVCIVPAAGGAKRLTVVDGQITGEEALIADGASRPATDQDCRGSETVQWAAGHGRLARTATLTCGKDSARTVAALAAFVRPHVWVEAQAVDADGTRSVRVRRYLRSSNQELPDGSVAVHQSTLAQVPASAGADPFAWTIDQVIDTSAKVPPELLQAVLTEVNRPFPLNSKALVKLADAGVSASVIDLMIAITNPRRFTVVRADGWVPGGGGGEMDWPGFEGSVQGSVFDAMSYAGMMFPVYAGLVFPGYYDPWLGYWEASCAGFWGCGDYYLHYPGWGYGGYGGWVEVDYGRPDGTSGVVAPHGRVVNGQGYTRVTERADQVAVSSRGNRSSGSGGEPVSSGSSSGSSGASPGGYSSGGSSGGGGERTAVPRGPGGL